MRTCPLCLGAGVVAHVPRALTKIQRRIVDYLRVYLETHGEAPTIPQIVQFAGRSQSTVREHLDAIEAKGWITRDYNAVRGIRLVDHRKEMPI